MNNFGEKVSFIRSVVDLLRGPYRPNHYKDVMLPVVVPHKYRTAHISPSLTSKTDVPEEVVA